ncbi:uncharacterized protein N7458_012590 [Penicillium daleae]|uniref:Aminoglycoside phosphotransferase domain-containing protein n=1 Tax=Penicillium daleae TaxID=63821 RepID=A0AAD6BXB7_9EURO|nr:uncharacterized protein N7458_012590 [Penicillium daleae]KAJ5433434.1 hypothetical protein N7458_012590 [Penicillium daleae]
MTTYVLYSPDSAIDEFFNSNTTVTRQQCDEFAISRTGVYIYEMEYLPGIAHIMARISLDDMYRQRNTIKDFARVRKELPSLFSTSLPFVLSHGDLNVMNFLVNPQTGKITGIVDWAESRILPFGFALHGLENLLGWTQKGGTTMIATANSRASSRKPFERRLTISPTLICI